MLLHQKGFTLIEIGIVIGILAVLSLAVILVLNPLQYIAQGRDAKRINDLKILQKSINFVTTVSGGILDGDGSNYSNTCKGEDNQTVYVSVPSDNGEVAPTSSGWIVKQVTSAMVTRTDGTGWLPIDFSGLGEAYGAPLAVLPRDPTNTFASGLYYSYSCGSYELNAAMESDKFQTDIMNDGGDNNILLEIGSDLTLLPVRSSPPPSGEPPPPPPPPVPPPPSPPPSSPDITSVSPSSRGQGAPNQDVVIGGTDFVSGASATFSNAGISVNSTTFQNSTQITAHISVSESASTGSGDITVTNPDNGNDICGGCFGVTAAPNPISVSPTSGSEGTSELDVDITGSNFQSGATVSFSGTGITVNSTTFQSATLLTANITIAVGATVGTRDITVVNGDQGTKTGTSLFTVSALGRYWVGGTGNWNDTAHWASSTGGLNGASVPTSISNVFFDANSFTAGGQTMTINVAASAKNITWANVANTPTWAGTFALNISGSMTLSSGMTRTYTGALTFSATTLGNTIILAGKTLGSAVTFSGAGGEWIIQDTFITTGAITLAQGTLNANNNNMTMSQVTSSNSNPRTITMGSGTWTLTGGSTVWNFSTVTNLTFNANTSSIIVNNTTATAKTFAGGGKTFYNFQLSGAGTGTTTISSSNTFNNFTVTSAPKKVVFTAGTTQTINGTMNVNGSSGNLVTVRSSAVGSTYTINASSFSGSYVDIQNSIASGAASPFACGTTCVNSGNNTNWTF